jgi:hypothetical protein
MTTSPDDISDFLAAHSCSLAPALTFKKYRPADTYPRLTTQGRYDSWEWLDFAGRWAIFSEELNASLAGGLDARVSLAPDAYRIPDEVRPFAAGILKRQASKASIFNDKKVRLISDFDSGSDLIELQETDYFSTLVTNDITGKMISAEDGSRLNGIEMLAEEGVIRHLAESPLSNHLGISVIAITSDDRMVVLDQALEAAHYPALLMPSGSGALAPDDIKPGDTLVTLAERAMRREIQEECGLADDLIARVQITGFARQLDRGGKPELYGVAFLDHPFEELNAKKNLFIAGIEALDLAGAPVEALPDILNLFHQERADTISFSLFTCLAFFEQYLSTVDEETWLSLKHG